jgi:hypothetical protein
MRTTRRYLTIAATVVLCLLLSGCGLLRSASPGTGTTPSQANPGEKQGAIPASKRTHAPPVDPAATAEKAVERFAQRYINWTYRTLAADQAGLAASAVGQARAAEEQARAQTAGDTPLRRAHIFNSGSVVSVARLRGGSPGEWVIDTREQTGGDAEYAGLQAAFHVTIATVEQVSGGWAVSAWRPQV